MTKDLLNIKKYNIIFVALILSVFIHIRFVTQLVIIRPFDFITVITFLYLIFKKEEVKEKISPGFYYIFPFLIFHSFSALFVSTDNFLRETLQVILIIMFAFIISGFKSKINYKKIIYYLLIGSVFLMTFVIVWHIRHNIWVGWKQLPDTRLLFTTVAIFLFAYLNTIEISQKHKFKIIIMFVGFFSILLMSGERKALLVFLFLILMHYTYGFPLRTIIALVVTYWILLFLANTIDNEYVSRILISLLRITETGNIDFTLQTGMLKEADSYSNLQRAFAFNISKEYFLRNPIIGIGTNNFILTLRNEHHYLPYFLMVGIHNEFFRIPVENGLVGLFLYLMIWYKSWIRTKETLMDAKKNGLVNDRQVVFLLYAIYLTLAVYVGTEASSTRSFLILVFISLFPDYIIYYFKSRVSK